MSSLESAISFLQDPKVSGSPLTQQIAFLESKGLSPTEIQQALASVNGSSPPHPVSAHKPYGFTDYTLAAATIVGLGYAGTRLFQVCISTLVLIS
jgi:anthranilate phosphoribosyltransferase